MRTDKHDYLSIMHDYLSIMLSLYACRVDWTDTELLLILRIVHRRAINHFLRLSLSLSVLPHVRIISSCSIELMLILMGCLEL
jgi:hypothetical protein